MQSRVDIGQTPTGQYRHVPVIPLELLEFLEMFHPDECPSLEMPDREIWYHAGQVSVVKFLRRVYDYRQKGK